jgi:hypothetical protein
MVSLLLKIENLLKVFKPNRPNMREEKSAGCPFSAPILAESVQMLLPLDGQHGFFQSVALLA